MRAIEFTTEPHGLGNDSRWQTAAYDQFFKDDSDEDAVYQALAEKTNR